MRKWSEKSAGQRRGLESVTREKSEGSRLQREGEAEAVEAMELL